MHWQKSLEEKLLSLSMKTKMNCQHQLSVRYLWCLNFCHERPLIECHTFCQWSKFDAFNSYQKTTSSLNVLQTSNLSYERLPDWSYLIYVLIVLDWQVLSFSTTSLYQRKEKSIWKELVLNPRPLTLKATSITPRPWFFGQLGSLNV